MPKLSVWIDGNVFENTFQHGIWRIFFEVMSRTANEVNYTLWLRNKPLQPIPDGVTVVQDSGRRYGSKYDVFTRIRRYRSIHTIPRGIQNADIFHASYFTTPPINGPVFVTSVYDMIAESHFGISADWAIQNAIDKRNAINHANVHLCISKSTADELHRYYPHTDESTRIVHLGSDHLKLSMPDHSPTKQKFALYVGQRKGYKNFTAVIDAMRTQSWPSDIQLHVVGPKWTDLEAQYIQAHSLDQRIIHRGAINDRELATVYHQASCLIITSLQEGFGLPVLKAQMNHCPVVCSDIPVFREVAGSSAVYYDPRVGEKIAMCLLEVLDSGKRRQMIESGFENAKKFRWKQTAEQTLEVYRETVEMKKKVKI